MGTMRRIDGDSVHVKYVDFRVVRIVARRDLTVLAPIAKSS